MSLRVVCYTCPHGLTPGPYLDWSAQHLAEHQWLLDVCAGPLQATHVNLPTEAFAHAGNGYTHEKAWRFCQEIAARDMTPVLWLDKWLATRPVDQQQDWLRTAMAELGDLRPIWNLSNELDLLWLLHANEKQQILTNLIQERALLLALGAPPEHIWAGGATVTGTLEIDNFVAPGCLTWTAWRAIKRGIALGETGVRQAVRDDLLAIQGARYRPGPLLAVEVGWSARNGMEQQAAVLTECLQGRADADVPAGLWTVVDWPHTPAHEAGREYGVLDSQGQSRSALMVWRQGAGP